ncbi:MAG: ABC transporter permease, partial [Proteobacteria bacterium]|nr:ABC transporter permease [Pseudomonadota bacterium]
MVFIRKLGEVSVKALLRLGRMGIFLAKTLCYTVTPPIKFSLIVKKIQFIGFQSISVIFLTGAFTGMVLGYQGYNTLSRFG